MKACFFTGSMLPHFARITLFTLSAGAAGYFLRIAGRSSLAKC